MPQGVGMFKHLSPADCNLSASPSSYLNTLPDNDVTPILSPHDGAQGGSGCSHDEDDVGQKTAPARLHVDTQSADDANLFVCLFCLFVNRQDMRES